MSQQFVTVSIQDSHRQNFKRNKSTIAKFYKLDERSLELVEVHEKKDESVHSYYELVVKDRNNKTATLKMDCLRTKTTWTDKPEDARH